MVRRLAAITLGIWILSLGLWSHVTHAIQTSSSDSRVIFRIIVVSSADKAQQLRDQVSGGASLVELARAESSDPSAEQGGLVGPVALSELQHTPEQLGDLVSATMKE